MVKPLSDYTIFLFKIRNTSSMHMQTMTMLLNLRSLLAFLGVFFHVNLKFLARILATIY
jgi:hypothetical protein